MAVQVGADIRLVEPYHYGSCNTWDDGATEYRQHWLYWIINNDEYTIDAGDRYVVIVRDKLFDNFFDVTHGWTADFLINTGTYAGQRSMMNKTVIEGLTDEQGYNFGEGPIEITPFANDYYPSTTWADSDNNDVHHYYRQKVTLTDVLAVGDIITDFAVGVHVKNDATVGHLGRNESHILAIWIESSTGHLKKVIYSGHLPDTVSDDPDGEWHATFNLSAFTPILPKNTHFTSPRLYYTTQSWFKDYVRTYRYKGGVNGPRAFHLEVNREVDLTNEEKIIGMFPQTFMRGRLVQWLNIPENLVTGATKRDFMFTVGDIEYVPDGNSYYMKIECLDGMYPVGQQSIDVEYVSYALKDILDDMLTNRITTKNLNVSTANFTGDEIIPYIKFKNIPALEAITKLGTIYDRYLLMGTLTAGSGTVPPSSTIYFLAHHSAGALTVTRGTANNIVEYLGHKVMYRDKATKDEITLTKRNEEGKSDFLSSTSTLSALGLALKSGNKFVGEQMDLQTFNKMSESLVMNPDLFTHVELRCIATGYKLPGERIRLVAPDYEIDDTYIISSILHDRESIESVFELKPLAGGISGSFTQIFERLRNLEQSMSQNQPAALTLDNSLLIGEYPDGADARNDLQEFGNAIRGEV